eukprot:CFRG3523T1
MSTKYTLRQAPLPPIGPSANSDASISLEASESVISLPQMLSQLWRGNSNQDEQFNTVGIDSNVQSQHNNGDRRDRSLTMSALDSNEKLASDMKSQQLSKKDSIPTIKSAYGNACRKGSTVYSESDTTLSTFVESTNKFVSHIFNEVKRQQSARQLAKITKWRQGDKYYFHGKRMIGPSQCGPGILCVSMQGVSFHDPRTRKSGTNLQLMAIKSWSVNTRCIKFNVPPANYIFYSVDGESINACLYEVINKSKEMNNIKKGRLEEQLWLVSLNSLITSVYECNLDQSLYRKTSRLVTKPKQTVGRRSTYTHTNASCKLNTHAQGTEKMTGQTKTTTACDDKDRQPVDEERLGVYNKLELVSSQGTLSPNLKYERRVDIDSDGSYDEMCVRSDSTCTVCEKDNACCSKRNRSFQELQTESEWVTINLPTPPKPWKTIPYVGSHDDLTPCSIDWASQKGDVFDMSTSLDQPHDEAREARLARRRQTVSGGDI